MVIDQPKSSAAGPLVLTTTAPATLTGSLTQFPPQGDLYQLHKPVNLVDPAKPDATVVTMQKVSVKLSGL